MIPLLSFIPKEASLTSTFFIVSLDLIMILYVLKVRKKPHKLASRSIKFTLFLCLLHYLFCMFEGDYFSYKDIVEDSGFTSLVLYDARTFHVELPYVAIINFVHNDYFLFRVIVWGGSMLLLCLTAKNLQLDKSTFVFYLAIYLAPFTSTSRVALALAVGFMGFSLIVKPFKIKYLSYVIGGLLCISSIWLHRSAPFLLLIYPLSLIKFDKKKIILLAILVPVSVLVISTGLVDYIFSLDTSAEDSVIDAQVAQEYLESDVTFSSRGPGELIRLFLSYLSYLLVLVVMIRLIWKGEYNSIPGHIQKYCNATLLIIIAAFVFLLMPGANTYKTFERLIGFAIVPAAFCLSYLLKNNIEIKWLNMANLAILGWVIYGLIYTLYLDIVS